jgi:predicted ATP-dependent endonuclease of OLD family
MRLKSIIIENYRSIEKLLIEFHQLKDESYTYSLIGENEAGKSSILQALALKDNLTDSDGIPLPKLHDFREEHSIKIIYNYELSSSELKEIYEEIQTELPEIKKTDINYSDIVLSIVFDKAKPTQKIESINVPGIDSEDEIVIKDHFLSYIITNSHNVIFWKPEKKYLISDPINISKFAANPEAISIPLKNCFELAKINNIQDAVNKIGESTEREHLEVTLGEKTTKHINKIWHGHPIKITFNISDGIINFHVKDKRGNGKAETANQRSDGFRQFISFLLTISAENKTNQLQNTILLLDEPETHLHPKAQSLLMDDLINITLGGNNNIALFATHSNYMIDKDHLDRNNKIFKSKKKTHLSKFDSKLSTFSSVNYEVFGICSTDYHNELYGRAQELSRFDKGTDFDNFIQEKLKNGLLKKGYKPTKGNPYDCSLSTYIRHQIHHPENTQNVRFTELELKQSIELLLVIIPIINSNNEK